MRQFKLSTDPKFAEKLHDMVGLYVDLPAHAVIFSVDEKSQIQALDRTQPGLPLAGRSLGVGTRWRNTSVVKQCGRPTEGKSYGEIAASLGVGKSIVWRAVQEGKAAAIA